MARFYGNVGYAVQTEVRKGVWQDVITERPYFGETMDRGWKYQNETDQVNDNIILNTDFEVIADAFMLDHFSNIRYICYAGTRWVTKSVSYDSPRVHLQIGGVYNGATPNS